MDLFKRMAARASLAYDSERASVFSSCSATFADGLGKIKASCEIPQLEGENAEGRFRKLPKVLNPLLSLEMKGLAIHYDPEQKNALISGKRQVGSVAEISYGQDLKEEEGRLEVAMRLPRIPSRPHRPPSAAPQAAKEMRVEASAPHPGKAVIPLASPLVLLPQAEEQLLEQSPPAAPGTPTALSSQPVAVFLRKAGTPLNALLTSSAAPPPPAPSLKTSMAFSTSNLLRRHLPFRNFLPFSSRRQQRQDGSPGNGAHQNGDRRTTDTASAERPEDSDFSNSSSRPNRQQNGDSAREAVSRRGPELLSLRTTLNFPSFGRFIHMSEWKGDREAEGRQAEHMFGAVAERQLGPNSHGVVEVWNNPPRVDLGYKYKDGDVTFSPRLRWPSRDAMLIFKRSFSNKHKLSVAYDLRTIALQGVYKYRPTKHVKMKAGYQSSENISWASLWIGDEGEGTKHCPQKFKGQAMVCLDHATSNISVIFRFKKRFDFP